jgi:hypothetical protein
MTLPEIIKQAREVASKATQEQWTGVSNHPFYAIVNKPAPSQSKHDNERPHYWRIEDVEHVIKFQPQFVTRLLDALEECILQRNSFESGSISVQVLLDAYDTQLAEILAPSGGQSDSEDSRREGK